MKTFFSCLFLIISLGGSTQELYPYSEPASNMPTGSLSLKLSSMFERGVHSNRILQRYMPEVMIGLNRKWMIHGSLSFSDMHENKFIWEAARVYAKWRFFSKDDIHKHFRVAAFAALNYTRNHLDHNEINLQYGDQGGVQVGLISTQLVNRFAVSGTVSLSEVIHEERWQKDVSQHHAFEAISYSLSSGYLLFPREYTDYNQVNVNLYAELLGGRNLDWPYQKYYIDLAPSVQFIFRSTGKLNLGYRFELSSDIYRLSRRSFMISYEHIFLNALKKKRG